MRFFFIALLSLILQSCLDLRNCNANNVIGRYYCYNNDKAINWIDIKGNGKFEHYYYEKDNIKLSSLGVWKSSEKDDCIIKLNDWKTFNTKGKNYDEYYNKSLWINRNYLDIGPDGESSYSFVRSDESFDINPITKKKAM